MIPVIRSPLLEAQPGVRHGFLTRQGGVSRGVYESLNLGIGSDDEPEAVMENRARAAAAFDVDIKSLLTCYQIHSATAVVATDPWIERPKADAIVTREPGLLCGVLTADCAPVLIADAGARIVAGAHAGWKGALGGVIESTVESMMRLGARPDHMVAAIGPCIGPDSYEVGLEFQERFLVEAPGSERFFKPGAAPEKRLFDLPGFVLQRLRRAGVHRAEWVGRDTLAEPDLFHSNRRAFLTGAADYGRLFSGITLI